MTDHQRIDAAAREPHEALINTPAVSLDGVIDKLEALRAMAAGVASPWLDKRDLRLIDSALADVRRLGEVPTPGILADRAISQLGEALVGLDAIEDLMKGHEDHRTIGFTTKQVRNLVKESMDAVWAVKATIRSADVDALWAKAAADDIRRRVTTLEDYCTKLRGFATQIDTMVGRGADRTGGD